MNTGFMRLVRTIGELDRRIRRGKGNGMKDLGLKSSHTVLLYLLDQNPEGLPFTELKTLASMDAGQASRTLQDLQDRGLIEKNDTRQYRIPIRLSEEGKETARIVSARVNEAQAMVRQGISEEQLESFYDTCSKMLENLNKLPETWR